MKAAFASSCAHSAAARASACVQPTAAAPTLTTLEAAALACGACSTIALPAVLLKLSAPLAARIATGFPCSAA